ncbi:MAG: hypothetical protein J2P59_06595, partial [Acidimicrobiales bacterium]|nr:hypothetical protein [Acidimicrobiales bacterium]
MASSELTSGTGPPGGVEVEWQFDALDLRPVERWLAALGSPSARPSPPAAPALPEVAAHAQRARRQVDVYLDTEDWRVRRAGFVLRVRK